MDDEKLGKPDRLVMTLLALSFIANIVLAVLVERNSAAKAALEQRLSHSDFISNADMATLLAGNPPTLGREGAPITLVVFEDFQCPYCRNLAATLKGLGPKQKNDIRIVFRQYPLPIHKFAHNYSELAACTAVQSNQAFWILYEYFYSQADPEEDATSGAVQELKDKTNVNLPQISSCLQEHQSEQTIARDIALGQKYDVRGTPTMFINGRRVIGNRRDLVPILQSMEN